MTKVSKAAIWIALCFVIARVSVTRAQRGAVASGTKYSPLDQINAVNVKQLQIVWRWKPDGFGPRPDSNWQVTPLLNGRQFIVVATGTRGAAKCMAASLQIKNRQLQIVGAVYDRPFLWEPPLCSV